MAHWHGKIQVAVGPICICEESAWQVTAAAVGLDKGVTLIQCTLACEMSWGESCCCVNSLEK